jgi:hypothetical protein
MSAVSCPLLDVSYLLSAVCCLAVLYLTYTVCCLLSRCLLSAVRCVKFNIYLSPAQPWYDFAGDVTCIHVGEQDLQAAIATFRLEQRPW